MEKLIFIRMESLFPTLFWGNVIALLFLLLCHGRKNCSPEKWFPRLLILARSCHAFYYLVASGRGLLPDPVSVNLGNTLLFVGFYCEGQAILRVIKENSKFTDWLLRGVLIASVAAFNAAEFLSPTGGTRIVVASLSVFLLMGFPVLRMLLSRDAGIYAKPSAIFYLVFLFGLLARAWYGLQDQTISILTTNILQSVTFLALLLQAMIALPSYTMIIKGYADEALIMMATTDHLTGATTRHAFLDAAAGIFKSSDRSGRPVSVLFLDVDHFKRINDTYGHAFGDTALQRVAALIDKCLRGSDLSCRYGGEEFMVLLPHADGAAAEMVAQRILEEVRQTRFDEQPAFSLTVSIGVATRVPPSEQEMDAVFRAADKAMYQAKREGRDRYTVSADGR
jgi:diguanylate cyclase (GGDEF)-like protein